MVTAVLHDDDNLETRRSRRIATKALPRDLISRAVVITLLRSSHILLSFSVSVRPPWPPRVPASRRDGTVLPQCENLPYHSRCRERRRRVHLSRSGRSPAERCPCARLRYAGQGCFGDCERAHAADPAGLGAAPRPCNALLVADQCPLRSSR